MRRLAIIDLATGRQPISNEDGSIWVVFNGEIYNYRELRELLLARGHKLRTRTDTETIAHLYEDEGERCVERLRGMFAFAIWDRRERRLFLARDRVGKKPLHYAMAGRTLVFGSEIKSLLQHPGVKREINLQAISDFLSFGYVPDPETAFAGVRKLPPGHTLTFKDGLIKTRRYWDFDYSRRLGRREPERREEDYIERLRELIAESVRLRLESDVPLGAFLSGGIDSSVVVAMMAREMKVKTFSIGFSDAGFDELRYARIAARYFGADHHEFVVTPDVCRLVEEIVWHHDEPFADVSSVPTYVVSKMAREHVTVALSGDGGDEVFGGYERYVVDRRRRRYERIPAFMRRCAAAGQPSSATGRLWQTIPAQHRVGAGGALRGQRHLLRPRLATQSLLRRRPPGAGRIRPGPAIRANVRRAGYRIKARASALPGQQDISARRHSGQSRSDEYGQLARNARASARPPPDRIRANDPGVIEAPRAGDQIHSQTSRPRVDPRRDYQPAQAWLRCADPPMVQPRAARDA